MSKGKRAAMFICIVLILLLYGAGVWRYCRMGERADRLSLRYARPAVSGGQIEDFWEANERKADETGAESATDKLTLTAWGLTREETVECSKLGRSVTADVARVYGDVYEALPFALTDGVYMTPGDTAGCLVSAGAAYALFGTVNVAGLPVSYEEKEYIVRGVFNTEDPILAISAGEEEMLPFLEVHNKGTASMETVKSNLRSGLALPEEYCYVDSNFNRALLRLALSIPFWALYFAIFIHYRRQYRGRRFAWIGYLFLAAALAALFAMSFRFGPDFIPAKWSDFDFWGDKFRELWENLLRTSPTFASL